MSTSSFPTLVECLTQLPDPRVQRTRRHNLMDILVLAICAVLCGAQGWDDIVSFAHAKRPWLQQRLGLRLENGLPCADTFRRVFARLDPQALETCFRRWTQSLQKVTQGEIIALDGKTLRHSFDTACGQAPIHMVSAWAAKARLVLGQVKVAEKANEITAVPALLRLLDLEGCLVTTDAMSCQKAIAAQIVEQGGEYVLALKDNHPHLAQDVAAWFAYCEEKGFKDVCYRRCQSLTKGHGRIETRRYEMLSLAPDDEGWGDIQKEWKGLRSFVRAQSTRQQGETITQEVRYFLCSIPDEAKPVAGAIRQHWGIENRVHYVLDVSFDEDSCRIRKDHGPQNLAVLRHIALNLLRQDKTNKRGIKARQKQAGWDNDYLLKVLLN